MKNRNNGLMRLLLTILLISGTSSVLLSQQFFTAGPDVVACPSKPTPIGPPDTNPNLCYKWEPADYLSCTDCPNPTVDLPDNVRSKQYTLYITEDLKNSFSDEMKVINAFGEVAFDKNYLEIKTGNTVTARLENSMVTNYKWGFEGDSLNCMIDKSTGIITVGDKYGKLNPKAYKSDDETCYIVGEINVNHGVKDVFIVDNDNPKRVAKNGQTLYLIDNANAKVRAIPNQGEEFGPEAPKWFPFSDPSSPFLDGEAFNSYLAPNGTTGISAGDPDGIAPKTYVNKSPSVTTGGNTTTLLNILNLISTVFKQVADFSEKAPPPSPKIEPSLTLGATSLAITTVEDYDSPEKGLKKELALGIIASISGTAYHPAFTKSFSAFGYDIFQSELGLKLTWDGAITGALTKDESIERSDEWIGSVAFTQGLSFQVFFNVIAGLGPAYAVEGGLEAEVKAYFKALYSELDKENIVMSLEFEPLSANFGVKLNKVTNPMKKKQIFGPIRVHFIDKKTYPLGKVELAKLFD